MKRKINKTKVFFFIILPILIIALLIYKNSNKTFNVSNPNNDKDRIILEKEEEYNKLKEENQNLINQITELNNQLTELRNQQEIMSRADLTREDSAWIWANVSAYCPCEECCGKTNGITASGTQAIAGRTIAASKNYPFGTQIEIEGMGVYTVEDRGGAITGNKLDIYFNTHQEALNFGRRQLKIKIVE